MKTIFGIFAALAIAGVAVAHTAVTSPLSNNTYYFEDDVSEISHHGYSIWQESNGWTGLQEEAFCADGSEIDAESGLCADADGRFTVEPVPADTLKKTISLA